VTAKEHMEAKIQQLIAKCDRLTRERDEARRIACGLIYDQAPSPATKESIAEAEGWDCYKEDCK
jgi:hypothetical protein